MKDIVTDFSQFISLKADARQGDPAALRAAAEQFESLFVQTMLKSMRKASIGDPIFGSSNNDQVYQQMFDQQLAREVASGPGVGLAELLVRQLGNGDAQPGAPGTGALPAPLAGTGASRGAAKSEWSSPLEFARRLWPYAKRVAARLGTTATAIIAQAALETGWGQRMTADAAGRPSYNFFGIKAGSDWNGPSVTKPTVEYANGEARREHAKFRTYPSAHAGFSDYLEFLESNPRYSGIFGHGPDIARFADSLQQAGYATDPKYAGKIVAIAGSDIMQDAIRGLKFGGLTPID